jgi:hypothetical protein
MEWWNGRAFNTHEGTRSRLALMFDELSRLGGNPPVEGPDGILAPPSLVWVPLWVCVFSELIVVGTILAFFGFAMHQNSHDVHWWVVFVVALFIAMKGLQMVYAVGYWVFNSFPFICYVYMEVLHLVGRFVFWTLIIFLVLGGGGNSGFGEAGGCLYNFAAR